MAYLNNHLLLSFSLRVTLVFLFSLSIFISYQQTGLTLLQTPPIVLSSVGLVVALLIGFRYRISYMRWWETRGVWGEILSQLRSFNSTLFTVGLLNRDALDKANQCSREMYTYIYLLNEIICEWNASKSNKIESPTAHFMRVKILIEKLRQAESLSHSTHLHLLQTMAKLSNSISAVNKLRFQKPPAVHDSLVKFTTLFFMLFFILTISQSTSVIVAIVCPPMVYSILNLVHVFAIRAERPFGKRNSDISSHALIKKSQTEAEVFYETTLKELENRPIKSSETGFTLPTTSS
jgi:ion channel-forming bestrophin family protein